MNTYGRTRRALAAGSGLTLAIGLAGCTGLSDDATRSGGTPPPVVLTIGTDDPEGRPASNQIEEFARQVDTLSGGAVRIEPRYRAAGQGIDDWDQAVARLVVSGDLDLGVIPARAWDTEGVTTLRALTTPLLITSDAHLDAVVLDDELSADLMSGLDEVGVTGLTLLPEGIRHLVAVDGRRQLIERLAAGGAVRSPWSETTWAFFEALGARPTDEDTSRGMVAAETELALAATLGTVDGLVGNLPLFPKVNSLVVNFETFGELTQEQQGWLREAATATRDWAVDTRSPDPSLAAELCEAGGSVIHVGKADSEVVTDAAETVTASLRRDAETADLIDRIAAVDDGTGSPVLPTCSASSVTPATITPDGGRLPNGVYRVRFSDDYLRDQGLSEEMIGYNHGVWTVTLRDGRWRIDQVAPDITDTFEGIYEVRGNDLYWLFQNEQIMFHVTWSLTEDGGLRFGPNIGGPRDGYFHFRLPWQRVGDVDAPEPQPRDVTADTIVADGGDLPNGTYRFRLSDDYLADHGLPPEMVAFNHGVWTTVLEDGHWTIDQVAPDIVDHLEGIYQVSGDDLWWRFHDEPTVIHLRWSVTADGDLLFEQVPEPEVPDFQFDLRWNRVD